ncbi:MAG: hypothetical protein GXP45_02115 [bacterium]|nr:hypothetical protein [bacterium]
MKSLKKHKMLFVYKSGKRTPFYQLLAVGENPSLYLDLHSMEIFSLGEIIQKYDYPEVIKFIEGGGSKGSSTRYFIRSSEKIEYYKAGSKIFYTPEDIVLEMTEDLPLQEDFVPELVHAPQVLKIQEGGQTRFWRKRSGKTLAEAKYDNPTSYSMKSWNALRKTKNSIKTIEFMD